MISARAAVIALAAGSACLAATLGRPALAESSAAGGTLPHPAYDHIVVVVMENQQYSTIIGNPSAPFENFLADNGALLTRSFGCEHPSQPNYLDLFSGSDQNIAGDSFPATNPFTTDNLGAELLHHGLTFVGYSEDLPFTGDAVDANASAPTSPPGTPDYARKHNPWANWQYDVFPASVANQGSEYLPSWTNETFAPFAAITAAGTFSDLPTVAFVIPNQQHDDHGVSGGATGNQLIADGDAWLQDNIGPYAAWAKKHNSLLIVTFDEDDFTSTNRIYTVFYGAHIHTGEYAETSRQAFTSVINADGNPSGPPQYVPVQGVNHWNVLRTIEDLCRVGHAGRSDQVEAIRDVFTPWFFPG